MRRGLAVEWRCARDGRDGLRGAGAGVHSAALRVELPRGPEGAAPPPIRVILCGRRTECGHAHAVRSQRHAVTRPPLPARFPGIAATTRILPSP